MKDDQKKMLTEKLLGEDYHNDDDGHYKVCTVCHIQHRTPSDHNRTFLTWQDLGDCKEA